MYDTLNSIADIEALIAGGFRECETLEYKAASVPLKPVDHKEVAKDVSAFANSAGGVVIYGVATDQADKTRPKEIERIRRENIDIILQVVATHIRHPITGLRHKTIDDENGPVCFIIEVPSSPNAPHQVITEYRYYRRNGAISEPMSHELIELYFGRRLGPTLRVTLKAELIPDQPAPPPFVGTFRFSASILNGGSRVARHLLLLITVPRGAMFALGTHPTGAKYITREADDSYRLGFADNDGVLHPELETTYSFTFSVHENFVVDPPIPFIFLDVHADEMKAIKYRAWIERVADGKCELRYGSAA